MPQVKNTKAPTIMRKRVDLESQQAKNLLVPGHEAVTRIQNDGAVGFCIYAGKPTHNTGSLVFVDHDDVDKFDPADLPDTFLARSGSGDGYHQTYINSENVQNAQAKGDLDNAGEVRANNQYIITPGSIHPSGGIYHPVKIQPPSSLSTHDLPPELQPDSLNNNDNNPSSNTDSTHSSTRNSENLNLREQIDQKTIKIAQQALRDFQGVHTPAFRQLMDRLRGGRGAYDSTLSRNHSDSIDRDLQEKTILTHLYGVFKFNGFSADKARELTYQFLSWYCVQPKPADTEDGNRRKWLTRNEKYRQTQLDFAIEQYDRTEFQRFCNSSSEADTSYKIDTNQYGDPTRGLSLFAVDLCSGRFINLSPSDIHTRLLNDYTYALSEDEVRALINAPFTPKHTYTQLYNDTTGPHSSTHSANHSQHSHQSSGSTNFYPKKKDVVNVCVTVDNAYKGNSEASFDECLNRLRREGKLKVAEIKAGTDYRIYRSDRSDPTNADWVRTNGQRLDVR
jgi:hypothetical protein